MCAFIDIYAEARPSAVRNLPLHLIYIYIPYPYPYLHRHTTQVKVPHVYFILDTRSMSQRHKTKEAVPSTCGAVGVGLALGA